MLIPLDILIAKYNLTLNGVLHLGCNTAQEAKTYHDCGIKKMIFVEAIPDICMKAMANVKDYDAQVILACLSDKEENVIFNIANNGGQSSSFLQLGQIHKDQHPSVKYVDTMAMTTKRFDTIDVDLTGIDYLVSDLQGVDLRAIKGMGKLLEGFKAATVETNNSYVYQDCDLSGELNAYMLSFGFECVETKWVGQWGDSIFVKK